MQAETCTDVTLLRPSRAAPLKSCNKIAPGTLQPHHIFQTTKAISSLRMARRRKHKNTRMVSKNQCNTTG